MTRAFLWLLLHFFTFCSAQAETRATLNVNVEGRNSIKRNRLILLETMSDKRDVMMVLSCRVDDQTLGAVLDFGGNTIWPIEGTDISITIDNQTTFKHSMSNIDNFLTLGGKDAAELFNKVLQGKKVIFKTDEGISASFELNKVPEHISRFKTLCSLGSGPVNIAFLLEL